MKTMTGEYSQSFLDENHVRKILEAMTSEELTLMKTSSDLPDAKPSKKGFRKGFKFSKAKKTFTSTDKEENQAQASEGNEILQRLQKEITVLDAFRDIPTFQIISDIIYYKKIGDSVSLASSANSRITSLQHRLKVMKDRIFSHEDVYLK